MTSLRVFTTMTAVVVMSASILMVWSSISARSRATLPAAAATSAQHSSANRPSKKAWQWMIPRGTPLVLQSLQHRNKRYTTLRAAVHHQEGPSNADPQESQPKLRGVPSQPQWQSAVLGAVAATAVLAGGSPLGSTLAETNMQHSSQHSTQRSMQSMGKVDGQPMMMMGSMMEPAGACSPLSIKERLDAYGDLGGFHHPVLTSSPTTQRLFDQGMLLAWNFNQLEAANSFRAALQEDPDCAMCHWGVAYAMGPYANKVAAEPPEEGNFYPVFSMEEYQTAQDSMQQALQLSSRKEQSDDPKAGDRALLKREKAYIQAMYKRYQGGTYGPSWERAERGYVDDMTTIAKTYNDVDATALAAEALMNLSPWDFYDPVTSVPRRITPKVLGLLEGALQQQPDHPLATHLYVHLTEGSTPGYGPSSTGRAEPAADALAVGYRSMGHLTHMASHNYLRTGRWHDGVLVNMAAIEVDILDRKRCLEPYLPDHNVLMLLYAAMTSGEVETAERYARLLQTYPEFMGPTYMSSGLEYGTLPLLWTRYAMWDQVLQLDPPPPSQGGFWFYDRAAEFSRVIYHSSRAMAFAAKSGQAAKNSSRSAQGLEQQAQQEVATLRQMVSGMPEDKVTKPGQGVGIYSIYWKGLSTRALKVAEARLAALHGDWSNTTQLLKEAVYIEDAGGYTEPPRAPQPARQCLGWALLQQADLDGAIALFEQDLREYPQNAWSFKGLQQAYSAAAGKAGSEGEKAHWLELEQEAGKKYEVGWQHADKGLQLNTSCPMFSDE